MKHAMERTSRAMDLILVLMEVAEDVFSSLKFLMGTFYPSTALRGPVWPPARQASTALGVWRSFRVWGWRGFRAWGGGGGDAAGEAEPRR